MNSLFFHSVYSLVFIKFALAVSSDPLPLPRHASPPARQPAQVRVADSCILQRSYFVIYRRCHTQSLHLFIILLLGKNSPLSAAISYSCFHSEAQKNSNFNGSPKCSSTKREQKSNPIRHCAILEVNCLFFVRKCWRHGTGAQHTMAHYSALPSAPPSARRSPLACPLYPACTTTELRPA